MRYLVVLLVVTITLASSLWAQETPVVNLEQHVRYLAADEREGRGIGTAGLNSAAQYIADHFARFGLKAGGDEGTYFQSLETTVGAEKIPVKNVIGYIEGKDPALQDAPLIIGAHYDHLGYGAHGSKARDSHTVHHGADDNASGVAIMLELARRFSMQEPPPKRPLIFIAFTAEEMGLLGSKYYTNHSLMPIDKTLAMLNFDMVGRLEDEKLIVFGASSAQEWKRILQGVNYQFQFDLALNMDDYGASDQAPFYQKDIPVLHFFTGAYPDHHTPADNWQNLNYMGMAKIADYVFAVVSFLAARESPLTFQSLGSMKEREIVRAQPSTGAWFGIVPDFAAAEGGMQITGTSTGSPAEAVGLKSGDILIEMDGKKIENIYDLSQVLKSHTPGDIIHVKYLREGKEMAIDVTLGQR